METLLRGLYIEYLVLVAIKLKSYCLRDLFISLFKIRTVPISKELIRRQWCFHFSRRIRLKNSSILEWRNPRFDFNFVGAGGKNGNSSISVDTQLSCEVDSVFPAFLESIFHFRPSCSFPSIFLLIWSASQPCLVFHIPVFTATPIASVNWPAIRRTPINSRTLTVEFIRDGFILQKSTTLLSKLLLRLLFR